jgi:hypothetical protein
MIVTQQPNLDGSYPGTWVAVGTFTVAGSPTAIVDPISTRIAVVARGTDNEIYRVFETAEGSEVWGEWARINPDVSDPAASDPTVARYRGTNGDSWLIAFRTTNDVVRVYERSVGPNGLSGERTSEFNARWMPEPTP